MFSVTNASLLARGLSTSSALQVYIQTGLIKTRVLPVRPAGYPAFLVSGIRLDIRFHTYSGYPAEYPVGRIPEIWLARYRISGSCIPTENCKYFEQ